MVTAIIVNYHSHLLAVRSAASVLADQPDAQVIVVDNSEDQGETRLLQESLPAGVECLVSTENIGFGRACNLAFGHARHDWILLLNPDAFVLEGCICTLVDFLRRTPRAGAVAPLAFWDEKKSWLLPPSLMATPGVELGMTLGLRSQWLGRQISGGFRRWALGCSFAEEAVSQQMLSGGHMLLRRSAVDAAGGLFDPDYFMYYEDTDLCQRLRSAGFSLYLSPKAQVVHEWCATQDKNDLAEVSRQCYLEKHFSRSWLVSWREWLERCMPNTSLAEGCDLGVCSAPQRFTVPPDWHSGWVLEVSSHPLLVPALYHSGSGDECHITEILWERLGPGDYWARLGPENNKSSQLFRWLIEQD